MGGIGLTSGPTSSATRLEKAGYVLEGRSRLIVTKAGRTGDRLLYALVRS